MASDGTLLVAYTRCNAPAGPDGEARHGANRVTFHVGGMTIPLRTTGLRGGAGLRPH